MPSLRQAYLQRWYTFLSIGIVLLTLLGLGSVFFISDTKAIVSITVTREDIDATANFDIGKTTTDTTFAATSSVKRVSASVQAAPSALGAEVDAKATGRMTIVNTSNRAQPLAVGTRLRSTTNIIVRTTSRIDVPAGQRVEVDVIADPLGESGNLAPGRFVIVALWEGLQDQIYGELRTAMTGGRVRQGSTLDVATLTKASDEATEKIRLDYPDQDGMTVAFLPISVTTNPRSSVASASYTVTVTMDVITLVYSQEELRTVAAALLSPYIPEHAVLESIEEPALTFVEQSQVTKPLVRIVANGQVRLTDSLPAFDRQTLVSKSQEEVVQALRAITKVKEVTVTVKPSWRKTLPSDPQAISIEVTSVAP